MMRVRFLLGAAFFALAAPAGADAPARADTPRVQHERLLVPPEAMIDAAREAEYFGHVAIGDRERAAGHIPEAAIACARALHIHKDPVVGGRLGVLLVQAGKYGQAADLLLIALQYARTTTAERESFFRAYELARKHGAWVDVVASEEGAAVALDGEVRNPEGYSAFSVFVVAGEHRLTAVLEGFHDATVPITVRAGEDMRVKIELRPLFKRLERTKPRNEPAPHASTNIVGDPNHSRKEDPFYSSPQPDKPKDADESRCALDRLRRGRQTFAFFVCVTSQCVHARHVHDVIITEEASNDRTSLVLKRLRLKQFDYKRFRAAELGRVGLRLSERS